MSYMSTIVSLNVLLYASSIVKENKNWSFIVFVRINQANHFSCTCLANVNQLTALLFHCPKKDYAV